MTPYESGRKFEYVVRADLDGNGYDVIRSAGSKTKVDLVAFKAGEVLLVQCKRDGKCAPAERGTILRVAALLPAYAVPIIACKQPRSTVVQYWRLTGLAPGDREPWTPDQVDGGAA